LIKKKYANIDTEKEEELMQDSTHDLANNDNDNDGINKVAELRKMISKEFGFPTSNKKKDMQYFSCVDDSADANDKSEIKEIILNATELKKQME